MTIAPVHSTSTEDPGEGEDEEIKRRRPPVVDLFLQWERGALGTATKARVKGDGFGELLAEARAVTYRQAAVLTEINPLADAAQEMMSRAKRTSVRTPPLLNFDSAGVQYVTARAWQCCAWEIDPDLPEVQRNWDEG